MKENRENGERLVAEGISLFYIPSGQNRRKNS